MDSARPSQETPYFRVCDRIVNIWRNTARCRFSRCGIRASTSKKCCRRVRDEESRKRFRQARGAARKRSVLEHDFPKLAAMSGRSPTIKDNPPLIYHPRDIERARKYFRVSSRHMQGIGIHCRRIGVCSSIDMKSKDVAIKVVGVGSVGTVCAVMLLMASAEDPLFLQVKEARQSVLEPYAGKSVYPNHGQRVVNGYRLIQSASDIFLGWTKGEERSGFLCPPAERHEAQPSSRPVQYDHDGPIRRGLRSDPGASSRTLRSASHDQRVSRQQ